MPSVPSGFIQAQILSEITSIVEDILECYVFEKIGLDNVYPYSEIGFKTCSLTVKDILINAFLGKNKLLIGFFLKTKWLRWFYLLLKSLKKMVCLILEISVGLNPY